METKFGKPILAQFHYKDYSVFVLDDKDWYNVHVIDPIFEQSEMNTLELQEPADIINSPVLTEKGMMEILGEHILWEIFYGYGITSWSVTLESCDEHIGE